MQPIQMTQCPLITQQALDFAPTVAWQLLARLVELGLRGLTAIKPPLGIEPLQSGGHLVGGLLGLPPPDHGASLPCATPAQPPPRPRADHAPAACTVLSWHRPDSPF